jgi:hypothetical protein
VLQFLHLAAVLTPKCDVILNLHDARPFQPVDGLPDNGSPPSVAPDLLDAHAETIATVLAPRRAGRGLMRRALPRPSRRLHSATDRCYRHRARSAKQDALRLRQSRGIILRREQASVDVRRHPGMFEARLDHLRLISSPRSARNRSEPELTMKTILSLSLAFVLAVSAAAISMTSSPGNARVESAASYLY